MKKIPCGLLVALMWALPAVLAAQTAAPDTLSQTREAKNRNVMLNASNDNQPRQISIGLPANAAVDIFEDGTPVSYLYWPSMPHFSWRNGVTIARQSLMSLSESALRFGVCKYVVDSEGRRAGDAFQGLVDYTTNVFGKQVVDVNLSAPMGNGWGWSAGTYQGFDPGSNHLDAAKWQNEMHLYRLNLSKRLAGGKGSVALTYKYVEFDEVADNNGLFYYNGHDGSVTPYQDFKLGHDQIFPDFHYLNYVDVVTGQRVRTTLAKATGTHTHHLSFNLDRLFDNGVRLEVASRLKASDTRRVQNKLAGIFQAEKDAGYTYAGGEAYEGLVQNRYMLFFKGLERSWMTTAQLSGQTAGRRHSWRLGLNEWWNRSRIFGSTGIYAHEAKKNPQRLLKDGDEGAHYNEGSEYFDGHENRLALYAADDWTVSPRLWLALGLRAEWVRQQGNGAFAYAPDGTPEEPGNERVNGFNLREAGRVNRFGVNNWFNPSLTLNARYTLLNGFGLVGEFVRVRQRPDLQDYAGAFRPSPDPVDVTMAKGGVYWNNPWLQLTSQLTYIKQTNYKAREQFTNPSDQSETVTMPVNYNVSTLGWTTDAVLTPFPGFTFHGLLTLQAPRFGRFAFQPVFSDGPGQLYDFTDKTVPAMSEMIVELDPAYRFGDWRVWLSFRYQSKQYINRTNTLYFKGRWETFGGVDYELNRHVSFSLNLVNILNQRGASGRISAADLATDVSHYQNGYLMSGTYIRPFTMELTAHLKF